VGCRGAGTGVIPYLGRGSAQLSGRKTMVIGGLRCFAAPCDKKVIDLWIDTRDCTPLGPGHIWSILNHRGVISHFFDPYYLFYRNDP